MKKLFFLAGLLLAGTANAQNGKDYVVTLNKDTFYCESFYNFKCKNKGEKTVKYKSKEVRSYMKSNEKYVVVNGRKSMKVVFENNQYKFLHLHYTRTTSTGMETDVNFFYIVDNDLKEIENVTNHKKIPTAMGKYFKGCEAFDAQVKEFRRLTSSKAFFPFNELTILADVYNDNCK